MTRSLGYLVPAVLLLVTLTGAQAQTADAGGCTVRTLPGEVICVCQPATDPAAVELLFDGRPAGPPVASAPGVLFFRLPAETPVGSHAASLTLPGAEVCTVEVILIQAQLDRERIWRGQGTPLRIEIEGTRNPVRLRITNETPNVVSLQGGNDQEANTSGGRNNTLERRVRGTTPGDFDIRYELLDATCPCGEFPGEGVFDPGDSGEPSREPTGETPGETPTEPEPTEPEPTEPDPTEPQPTEPQPTEPQPGDPTPTEPEPQPTPPITAPPPTEPPPERPPPESCASIGEEIERMKGRYAELTGEITHQPIPETTVVTPGPTGHKHCDRSYTTWTRGAQAVSIHRMLTQVRDLADFCLGHGTCTPEGHRAYMADLQGFAATVQADSGFVSVAREMPAHAGSVIEEYRYELEQVRKSRSELETTLSARDPARTFRLHEAASRVRSYERQLEQMELWRAWSRELVTALENGSLLDPSPTRRGQETSP